MSRPQPIFPPQARRAGRGITQVEVLVALSIVAVA